VFGVAFSSMIFSCSRLRPTGQSRKSFVKANKERSGL
jgi:hypothetical protein